MAGKSKTHLTIEESGGFVGASPTAHFRTRGEVEVDALPEAEQAEVRRILKRGAAEAAAPGPRYRLSWEEDGKACEAEVGESELTPSLRASLKTDLI